MKEISFALRAPNFHPDLSVSGYFEVLGMVGVRGFEPPTSASQTLRAKPTALHPVRQQYIKGQVSVNRLPIYLIFSGLSRLACWKPLFFVFARIFSPSEAIPDSWHAGGGITGVSPVIPLRCKLTSSRDNGRGGPRTRLPEHPFPRLKTKN